MLDKMDNEYPDAGSCEVQRTSVWGNPYDTVLIGEDCSPFAMVQGKGLARSGVTVLRFVQERFGEF